VILLWGPEKDSAVQLQSIRHYSVLLVVFTLVLSLNVILNLILTKVKPHVEFVFKTNLYTVDFQSFHTLQFYQFVKCFSQIEIGFQFGNVKTRKYAILIKQKTCVQFVVKEFFECVLTWCSKVSIRQKIRYLQFKCVNRIFTVHYFLFRKLKFIWLGYIFALFISIPYKLLTV